MTVWTHSQGVFPLRGELVKALKMPASAVRCIHTEGSGCYGHNGADDVALDAALLARALPGRPVRLQWMRDDEFKWEPYGPAMVMRAKAALADGKIADWEYELWSNTHSTRPQSTSGTNVLAAWYLGEPQKMGPPSSPPQPAGGGDRNALPLYDFPSQRVIHHFVNDMPIRVSALRTLGAYANVFALESFMDELAAAAGADPVAFRLAHIEGPARQSRDRGRGESRRWKTRRNERWPARPWHRFLEVQEPRLLRRRGGRGGGRPRDRRGAGAAHLGGGQFRTDRQSGRTVEPDRRRHRAVGELDPDGGGAVRQERHPRAGLRQLSGPDDTGRPEGRDRNDQPAGRTRARRRRGLARARQSRRSPTPLPMQPGNGCATCLSIRRGSRRLGSRDERGTNGNRHQNAAAPLAGTSGGNHGHNFT